MRQMRRVSSECARHSHRRSDSKANTLSNRRQEECQNTVDIHREISHTRGALYQANRRRNPNGLASQSLLRVRHALGQNDNSKSLCGQIIGRIQGEKHKH